MHPEDLARQNRSEVRVSGDESKPGGPTFSSSPLPPLPLLRARSLPPRQTSTYATWALLLGLLAIVCIGPGPILGMAAIALGVLGHRETTRERGRLGGKALAIAGIALGMLSFAVFGGLVAMYLHHARDLTLTKKVIYASPPITSESPESSSASEGSQAPNLPDSPGPPLPTISTVATIGTITVIDVASGIASLSDELHAQRLAAAAHDQKLVVETIRGSCPPCEGVAEALGDARMQKALSGVRLVRIDRDQFHEDLQELKIPSDKVPSFFLLDSDLRVLDAVAGDEWDEDRPANIAPVLGPFIRGTYTKRRTPFKAPRPSGTVL